MKAEHMKHKPSPVRWRSRQEFFAAGLAVPLALLLGAAVGSAAEDPFAGVEPAPAAQTANGGGNDAAPAPPRYLLFRKELFLQFTGADDARSYTNIYSRHSIGFEALTKFSGRTATLAAIDLQMRLVRRDNFIPTAGDMHTGGKDGFALEVHNAYVDLYNVLNPALADSARARNAGRFNVRIGHFYLPFGMNLLSDTHGTLMQLSNGSDLGFDRDWQAGLWGSLSPALEYNAACMLGSGDDWKAGKQGGLLAARTGLSNGYLNEHGWQAGLSALGGERLAMDGAVIDTRRIGIDGRCTGLAPRGTATLTAEAAFGTDDKADVSSQLLQLDYLHRSRRWGLSAQYRRNDLPGPAMDASGEEHAGLAMDEESRLFGEFTWYFRNDIDNSTLHWLKLHCEQRLDREAGDRHLLASLQYYRYW